MNKFDRSWDWEDILSELSCLLRDSLKFFEKNKKFDPSTSGISLLKTGKNVVIKDESLFKLLILMRSRMLEFYILEDQYLYFIGTKERIISQLTALKHDLEQIEIVFGEWLMVEKKDEWHQLFNEYMLQYSQGDASLEQIFWGKLIWDWAMDGRKKFESKMKLERKHDNKQELTSRFDFLWQWIQMSSMTLKINSKKSKFWVQRLMPLNQELVSVLCDESSEQWEVMYVSKILASDIQLEKINPSLISQIPFYFSQGQKILYEWLDFSALSEERFIFKVKGDSSKPMELPGPTIPYIHHLSMVEGKNCEYFISAMATPREELWDWLGSNFQQVEILSPGRWKKMFNQTTKQKNGH